MHVCLYECRQFQSVNQPLYMTSSHPAVPRLCFVSTVANQSLVVPYLFCNYQHRPCNNSSSTVGRGGGGGSHHQQRCDVECWEAIMASTAAPGFFKEVKLGSGVFMVRLQVN